MVKGNIRKLHLEKRAILADKTNYDKAVEEGVITFAKDFNVVAIFNSFGDEINTKGMIQRLLDMDKIVACPIIKNRVMRFVQVENLDDFKEGYFGIHEPTGKNVIEKDDFDLVIVPLLAFNDKLFRIGYGGGYYDKFLKNIEAFKLGVAHSWMHTDVSFEDVYDISLDNIMTEKGLFNEEKYHKL